MEFIIEEERIYVNGPSGNVIAEVTFPTVNGISIIDHTFVDSSLRGGGIAGQLVKAAADRILSSGNKIGATCSYAVAWFKRHPEYPVEYTGPESCKLP